MAPLSKLTLTSYRRTQHHRGPVEERRSKTLAALEQQKLVLAAALNGQEHTVTKPGWARDTDGNRQRIEKTHAVRPWFFQDAEGWVVQLKYGARVVPLDADNNAVIVQSLNDVAAVLDIFAKAVVSGELDNALATLALPGLVSSRMCSLTLMVLLVSFINQVYDQKSQRKTKLCSSDY